MITAHLLLINKGSKQNGTGAPAKGSEGAGSVNPVILRWSSGWWDKTCWGRRAVAPTAEKWRKRQ